MPIDFNPHVQTPASVQVVQQHYPKCFQTFKDIFIKSPDVNYEGIKIEKKSFGKIEKTGETAILYTITNKNGASVNFSTYGATITGIKVPDKNGNIVDVTHGYNNVAPYEKSPVGHAGGTIGPYANKIDKGYFVLNDKVYPLECNKDNGTTHSHGASAGLDIQNWKAKPLRDGIEFSYLKKDMVGGYPGNVKTSVTYKFDNNNNLHILYKAQSDKDTIINLTNHTYFNLDGADKTQENSVLNHFIELPNSNSITKVNEIGIPTGEFMQVKDTPFDFTETKKIADVINQEHEQLQKQKGFDHNYCVNNYDGKSLVEIAKAKSENSGITLKVSTNLPGFQFYTGNNLGKDAQPAGKNGAKYEKRSGFCIEPQFFPNAINTEAFSEKGILRKNEIYNKEIVYSFGIE